jgi:hypothetical protein
MSVVGEQLSIGLRWLREERRVVCALLIDAEGSSPFEPGAFMLIDADGAIEGSITGGCVESRRGGDAHRDLLAGDGAPRTLTLRRVRRGRARGRADVRRHCSRLRARAGRWRASSRAEVFDAASRGLAAGLRHSSRGTSREQSSQSSTDA